MHRSPKTQEHERCRAVAAGGSLCLATKLPTQNRALCALWGESRIPDRLSRLEYYARSCGIAFRTVRRKRSREQETALVPIDGSGSSLPAYHCDVPLLSVIIKGLGDICALS